MFGHLFQFFSLSTILPVLLLLPSSPTRPCRVESSRPKGLDEKVEEVGQAEDVETSRAPEEGDSLEVVVEVEVDHKTGKIP